MIVASNLYSHGQLIWRLISLTRNGQDIELKKLTIPVKISFEFDIYTNLYTYILSYVIISLTYFFGVYMYVILDSFFFATMNYCRSIFLLINRKIEIHFSKYDQSPAGDKNMQKEFRQIVELHIEAFQLVQDLEKVANSIALIMMIILSFAVCLNGFAIVSIINYILVYLATKAPYQIMLESCYGGQQKA